MAIYYSENVKIQKIITHKEFISATYVKTYIDPITIFGITLKEGYFVYDKLARKPTSLEVE